MKTRIRKKEYSNGKIEYVCEKSELPEVAIVLFTISLICLLAFFYYLSTDIICFLYLSSSICIIPIGIRAYKHRWNTISYLNAQKYSRNAVFDNLNDAKNFIDSELKKEADSKLEEYGKETKKQTIIKHP